ncbi:MAG: aminoacyl-tRNA deacylase [Ignavibacteria bacterium GWB2_35_6b]|nr:MAG: aminoacyl-tRNA deacylase [Ignavibacteria bacterium GWB2_35_6b]
MSKTNAVRILEAAKIAHQTFEYEVNEDELDAVSVADKINAEHEQVFKTLIARNDKNENFVFCIPGNCELDLKKAAKASSNKKIEMIKVKEILPLTGYIRGGCSPIGMKKLFPTFIDETAQLFDEIYVSAGMRGMQVKLSPVDLKNLITAWFADLI